MRRLNLHTDMKPLMPLKNRRGMALLITLTVISLLMITTVELNRRTRSDVQSTAIARDRYMISEMLTSGVHLALALLAEDRRDSEADSLQEDWADPDKIQSLLQSIPFDQGEIALQISDERSRVQVNALVKFPEGREFNENQRRLWERILRVAMLAHEQTEETDSVSTIVNSLKDWMDSGDDDAITGLTGAESDFYQDLSPPYGCRNGMFTHPAEILQVQGMTPELFYGDKEIPGLIDYLTVMGMTDDGGGRFTFDGRININTAPLPVLMALLPEENQDLAVAIDEYRQEKDGENYVHDLTSPTWYRNVPGAGDITIDADLITTRSDFFRIDVQAKRNGIENAATVFIQREPIGESDQIRCRILSWEQD
ncbi:MAG TPA: type II secretion system minor pseudopilin GspK [Desulfobacterales bacterium]